jgi:plastocyanin
MRRFLIGSAAAALLALPAAAGAAPRQIAVGDDFFSPKRPPARALQPGSSFNWSSGGGTFSRHNVRQDDNLFFSGNATRSLHFSIKTSAGSFHYYCDLHGSRSGGMSGVVKVRPIVVPDSSPGETLVRWAAADTNTGSRFDVRYRVDNRRWKTWKNDTAKVQARFGRNDGPVDYRPNAHTYRVKVRSERRQVAKRSGFSPAIRLNP